MDHCYRFECADGLAAGKCRCDCPACCDVRREAPRREAELRRRAEDARKRAEEEKRQAHDQHRAEKAEMDLMDFRDTVREYNREKMR